MSDADVVVIGAGPNGQFAACRLARAGLRVQVLERSERPGGALWSAETTGPGVWHDVGAGFVAFHDAAAFRALDLEQHGLRRRFAPIESAHPAPDGTCAAISRDPSAGAHFGAAGSVHDGSGPCIASKAGKRL